MVRKSRLVLGALAALVVAALLVLPAMADPVTGAIFTTTSDGQTVNGNIYESKDDVYLNGGPQPKAPCDAAGLPDGEYYFQVTDPSGATLLSTDDIENRRMTVTGGVITGYVCNNVDPPMSRGTAGAWALSAWDSHPSMTLPTTAVSIRSG